MSCASRTSTTWPTARTTSRSSTEPGPAGHPLRAPFFPLGGFHPPPIRPPCPDVAGTAIAATPMARSPTWHGCCTGRPISLLIPGTSARGTTSARTWPQPSLSCPPHVLADLDGIAKSSKPSSVPHAPPDAPLTLDPDPVRGRGRHPGGSARSRRPVVDVARALGVSHTAVHKHVGEQGRAAGTWSWAGGSESTMPPASGHPSRRPRPAPGGCRKPDRRPDDRRQRDADATDDPELFSAYGTLAGRRGKSVVVAHIDEMIHLVATIVPPASRKSRSRTVDPTAMGRAVLVATSKFHHPARRRGRATQPSTRRTGVWQLLMDGLRPPGPPVIAPRVRT